MLVPSFNCALNRIPKSPSVSGSGTSASRALGVIFNDVSARFDVRERTSHTSKNITPELVVGEALADVHPPGFVKSNLMQPDNWCPVVPPSVTFLPDRKMTADPIRWMESVGHLAD